MTTLSEPVSKASARSLDKVERPPLLARLWSDRIMLLLVIPGLIYFVVFQYLPLIGYVIAFKDYSPFLGVMESPWVGLDNFRAMVSDARFWQAVYNTLAITLLQLVFFFPAPIALALLLNSLITPSVRRIVQTTVYMPHFLSWVIVVSIFQQLFGGGGVLNQLLRLEGFDPINIMNAPELFKAMVTSQLIWKETGWGTIIYLAALLSIDNNLYEAAAVDGANARQRLWHVTLPGILGVTLLLLILRLGTTLTVGFEQILLQRDAVGPEAAEVLDTYVYYQGIVGGAWGVTAAAGLIKGLFGTAMVIGANKLAHYFGQPGIYPMILERAERPAWMGKASPFELAVKAVVLAIVMLVMIYPFLTILATSLATEKETVESGGLIFLWPKEPTLDAYRTIFAGSVVSRALLVSFGITVVGTALSLMATIGMAYGLSRPIVGGKVIVRLVLFSLFFAPGIIPSYLVVRELGLLNTYAALILPVLVNAFNLLVMRQFFMSIPQELIDAAVIDGASELQVLFRIVLPLSKAVIAVIALFYAVAYWNAFFNALIYLNDSSMWPLQVVVRLYVLQGYSLPGAVGAVDTQVPPPQSLQMAIIVVAILPILLVYPFLQRHFSRGVLTGSIKG